MFRGSQIAAFVALLERREASVFHACQYLDFLAYLNLGGIPSRALLEQNRQTFTTFDSDGADQEHGVWDKVFVNFSDFGLIFTRGHAGTPNVYGPILFQIHPRALLAANDLAVTLRSAGARDFNRANESLNTLEEVERIFLHPAQAGFPNSSEVRFGKQLEQVFPKRLVRGNPEINSSMPSGRLDLKHTTLILVDPYIFAGQRLVVTVATAAREHGLPCKVVERQPSQAKRYNELTSLIADWGPSFQSVLESGKASSTCSKWLLQLSQNQLEWQFERFARYLLAGTLAPLKDG